MMIHLSTEHTPTFQNKRKAKTRKKRPPTLITKFTIRLVER